ncbi:MAG: beta-Ig-H3/fasciclin [Muricauda sp.]|nr:fasciclin domain-containing protein [Allomuricauda sp.]MBC29329.1 beta-Ig-H3/fasciclin [Allomuricauda sp.]|tara:strand:+ start:991 stop:1557 length:567 start_codon:yes stop_codon:yes gene_type:complete
MRSPHLTVFLTVFCLLTLCVTAQKPVLSAIPAHVYLTSEKTLLESASSSKEHRILTAALKAADLDCVLDGQGPFTIFAPSDKAFSKLSEEKIDELLRPENKKALKALLTYHIVAGEISASKILLALCRGEGRATFTTVQGKKLFATIKGSDIVLIDAFGNRATITKADSKQQNGIIHVIDNVVVPTKI